MLRRRLMTGLACAGLVAWALSAAMTAPAASGAVSCSRASWPVRAAGRAPRTITNGPSVFVGRRRKHWVVTMRAAAHQPVSVAVHAAGRMILGHVDAPARRTLKQTRHGFSVSLNETRTPATVDFTVACGTSVTFRTAGHAFVGAGPAPGPAFALTRPANTGVAGQVIAGPTCPIPRPGCPPARPVASTLNIQTAPDSRTGTSGNFVKSVTTDASGNFATDLAPGNYMISAQASGPPPPSPTGSSTSRSVLVEVQTGVVTETTVTFDTGIR